MGTQAGKTGDPGDTSDMQSSESSQLWGCCKALPTLLLGEESHTRFPEETWRERDTQEKDPGGRQAPH